MGFDKFGRKSFTAVTKTAKFVDLLGEGKIEGTVCKKCGAKFFPPRADCSSCLSNEMDWFAMPNKGKLKPLQLHIMPPSALKPTHPIQWALSTSAMV
jgi:uncharacterized OB-fold protein